MSMNPLYQDMKLVNHKPEQLVAHTIQFIPNLFNRVPKLECLSRKKQPILYVYVGMKCSSLNKSHVQMRESVHTHINWGWGER